MATPAQTFLGAYQAADASMRDWQRIAMQQQAQANALAQQRIENEKRAQAQDFNQMLALLKRGDENTQFGQTENRLWAGQRANIAASEYNAATGRMNAATQRYNQQMDARRFAQQQNFNNDPLGLMGGSDSSVSEPPLPVPGIPDPQGGPLFNFGGRTYSQDWGPTTATVFGGADDPEDNGLSAFGGVTGTGGREGVAIPQRVLEQTLGGNKADWSRAGAEVTLSNGQKAVLPIADLGTAERIWERNQGPTLDLTPGAVNQLGGTVLRDNSGKQAGVRLPAEIANVRVVPDYQQAASGPVAAEPPDLSVPEPIAFAPASAASVASVADPRPSDNWSGLNGISMESPLPAPSGQGYGLAGIGDIAEPPLPAPASFTDDLSAPVSRQLTQLRRESDLLKIQESQATQMARAYQSQVSRIKNPIYKQAYAREAQRYQDAAIQARIQGAEAQAAGQRLSKDENDIRALQEKLGGLSVMDGVLPDSDVNQIKTDASNGLGRGITESRIKTLTDYNEVRQRNDLNHLSNGYVTAERVAIAGKRLEEAKGDRKDYDKWTSLQAAFSASGDDPKEQKKIKAKIEEAKPGAERWQRVKSAFDQAVAADTRPDPNAPAQETPATESAPPAPPADIFAEADRLRGSNSSTMSAEDQKAWTDAKQSVYRMFGGREGVVRLLARESAGEVTLPKLRRILRNQLNNLQPEDGEDFNPAPGFTLPKNADSLTDVADALAEDLFNQRGASANSSTVPNSPGISEKGRKLIESVSKSSP